MGHAPDVGQAPSDPVDEFSNCHQGIVAQLDELSGLPALLEPAAKARQVAAQALKFFHDAVLAHHAEEEGELFPAVLASAAAGDERDTLRAITEQLTREHREVEAAFKALEPALKAVAKGQDGALDGGAVQALVKRYRSHAHFEEQNFLPRAKAILGRNGNHLAALGISMHMRHAMPEVMRRFAGRI